jgi:two-component system nitrogen regulation response regulator NtrX
MILAPGKVVTAADVTRVIGEPVGGDQAMSDEPADDGTFQTFKQEAERVFLIGKLREHDWNVSETARALRMPRSNLYKKIERYGLTRDSA